MLAFVFFIHAACTHKMSRAGRRRHKYFTTSNNVEAWNVYCTKINWTNNTEWVGQTGGNGKRNKNVERKKRTNIRMTTPKSQTIAGKKESGSAEKIAHLMWQSHGRSAPAPANWLRKVVKLICECHCSLFKIICESGAASGNNKLWSRRTLKYFWRYAYSSETKSAVNAGWTKAGG